MQMQPCESTTIAKRGYDKERKLLHVEFKGGDVYAYKNVPVDVGFEFMNAQSAGRHFHANIRHNYAGKPPQRYRLINSNTNKEQ